MTSQQGEEQPVPDRTGRLWHGGRRILDWARWPFEWVGRNELGVLLGMLVVAVSVWGFMAIADEVAEGDTRVFDEWSIQVLRDPARPGTPRGPAWLAEVARDFTALGGIAFLTLLTSTVAGFLWLKRMRGEMLLVLAATLGGLLASLILKSYFDRPRPELVPHLSHVMTSSFPSGHSMMSATVFLTLGTLLGKFLSSRRLKAYFLLIAIVLTSLVGTSRVYLGVHYPTDVVAGWVAGLAWAVGCWMVAGILQRRGAVTENLEAATTP